jgi:hypothetical protein
MGLKTRLMGSLFVSSRNNRAASELIDTGRENPVAEGGNGTRIYGMAAALRGCDLTYVWSGQSRLTQRKPHAPAGPLGAESGQL